MDVHGALRNPETTRDKRVREYTQALLRRGRRPKATQRVIPGLDVAALQRKYGADPANTTQYRVGSFKVPINITVGQWEKLRNVAAEKFLAALDQQGWVVSRLTAKAGVYPYRDVLSGQDDPDYREMHLVAECGYPKAEPVVVELTTEELEPIVQTR